MSKGKVQKSKRARQEEHLRRQLEFHGAVIHEKHRTSHVSGNRGRRSK